MCVVGVTCMTCVLLCTDVVTTTVVDDQMAQRGWRPTNPQQSPVRVMRVDVANVVAIGKL
eukprot:1129465-Pelagomonas_calceolata.AAC.2